MSRIVAIDGPAGAGKSTAARAAAEQLGWTFLDTGAMYRAVTLEVLGRSVEPADGEGCGEVARELDLRFDDEGRIQIDGAPGEPAIRGPRVTEQVSIVSAHRQVREAVIAAQRGIARGIAAGGLVAEGRDTTTVVFPEASFKFFLVASAAERARRRAAEQGDEGRADEVRLEMEERDRLDSTRALSPLVLSSDAELLDTEGLSADQVAARIVARVRGAQE